MPLAELYYVLYDGQTETYSFLVYASSCLQFSEAIEKLSYVFLSNSCASVDDLCEEHLLLNIVARNYLDKAICRELEGVLYQVNQHLLESARVTEHPSWKLYFVVDLLKKLNGDRLIFHVFLIAALVRTFVGWR